MKRLSILIAALIFISGVGIVSAAPLSSMLSVTTCPLLVQHPKVASVLITVINEGTTPTGRYDQMLSISPQDYAPLVNSNLSNVYFTLQSGACVPSWIEANASMTFSNTPIWVLLPSIPPLSAVYVWMNFAAPGTFLLSTTGPAGEAPGLSSRYGSVDDGAVVFPFYWNFVSLPSGWSATTSGSGRAVVSNGLSVSGSVADISMDRVIWSPPLVVDYVGTLGFGAISGGWGATMGAVTSFDDTGWGTTPACSPIRGFYNIEEYPAGGACNATVVTTGASGVFTFEWRTAHASALRFDYGKPFDLVVVPGATTASTPGFQVVGGPTAVVSWLRARAYVPQPILVVLGATPLPKGCYDPGLLVPDLCV